jgi:sulfhydrogenase subunit alpha
MTHKSDRVLSVTELARVEGEGALYIRASGNTVEEARLDIYEPPRFFEAFLRGRAYTEPPDITARICGICPVAYQMSACRAIEDACGVTVDGPIADLRRLLYCGEWIESHALHIYLLHAPDFLGYRSGIEMATARRDIVERGLALKKAGNAIMEVVGGRAIHPVNVRVGGFYRAPARAELATLADRLRRALDDALATVAWVAGFDFPDHACDADMLALSRPGAYPIERGTVATRSGLAFAAGEWDEHVIEEQVPHSTALHAHLADGGRYLTGPLARYSLSSRWLSPLAREAARDAGLGPACDNPFRSIIVRAVETVYAVEEALRLIAGYEPPDRPAVDVPPRRGVGYGVTEAPRGTLYHRYEIGADGIIKSARIVPPTSQNQAAIEADLRAFVQARIDLDDAELTRQCEQAIRNYDPCISCSAHFLDLTVERSFLSRTDGGCSFQDRPGRGHWHRQRVPPRRRRGTRGGGQDSPLGTAGRSNRGHRWRAHPADRGLDRGGAGRRGRRGARSSVAAGDDPPFPCGPAGDRRGRGGELARPRLGRRDQPGHRPGPDAAALDHVRDRGGRPGPGRRPDAGRRLGRRRRGRRHPGRHRCCPTKLKGQAGRVMGH